MCVCPLCLQPKCNSFLGSNSQQGYSKHSKSLSCLTCRASIRPQSYMSLVWFDLTELASATEHYKSIAPQAFMSSVWFNLSEIMRACGLILCLTVLVCSNRFGVLRPSRTCLSSRALYTRSCMRPQARMTWSGSTLPNLPEQQSTVYKSKYQARSSHILCRHLEGIDCETYTAIIMHTHICRLTGKYIVHEVHSKVMQIYISAS